MFLPGGGLTSHNPHLQAAWRKYGSGAFLFEVVEGVAVYSRREALWRGTQDIFLQQDLLGIEDKYLQGTPKHLLYNICTKSGAVMSGRQHTAETKLRMRAAHTTPEVKKIHSEAMLRRWRLGELLGGLGNREPMTKEQVEKIKDRLGQRVLVVFKDGTHKVFRSQVEASKEIGCKQPSFSLALKLGRCVMGCKVSPA